VVDFLKYNTVSSVVLKVGNELQKDKRLKRRINGIQKLFDKGQWQTWPFSLVFSHVFTEGYL